MDPEPGAPHDFVDPGRPGHWPPRVQEGLHVDHVGMLRRVIHGRHNPVASARQRRHHHEPLGRNEQHHFVGALWPTHPYISEHERLRVRVPGETNAGALAHRAVHAVGAHDVSGTDRLRSLFLGSDRHEDTVGVLPQVVDRVWPVHVAAQLAQPVQEDRLGDILRNHQGMGVSGGQPVEGYRGQHMVAVPKCEPGHDVALGAEPVGDLQFLQDFERSGVHHGGARGVGTLGKAVDENEGDAFSGENAGQGKSCGPSPDDHDISSCRQRAHLATPRSLANASIETARRKRPASDLAIAR